MRRQVRALGLGLVCFRLWCQITRPIKSFLINHFDFLSFLLAFHCRYIFMAYSVSHVSLLAPVSLLTLVPRHLRVRLSSCLKFPCEYLLRYGAPWLYGVLVWLIGIPADYMLYPTAISDKSRNMRHRKLAASPFVITFSSVYSWLLFYIWWVVRFICSILAFHVTKRKPRPVCWKCIFGALLIKCNCIQCC